MVSMDTLDVFDLSTGTWSKQTTSGAAPEQRVNLCAVLGSNQSSQNIYIYGGQDVYDAAPRPQYNDVWILALPSFTWIEVGEMNGNPAGRSGHTCHAIGGQMVVIGGYLGANTTCDTPGIYVFDMSNLDWTSSFNIGNSYSVPQIVESAVPSQSSNSPTATTSPTSTATNTINIPSSTSVSVGNAGSLTTRLTAQEITTTFANGETGIITATFQVTATVTSTPPPSAAKSIPSTKLAAIVGGTLGAAILILAGGFGVYALIRRRQDKNWVRFGFGSPDSDRSERAWPASDEAESETREWDVHWGGNVMFSPRQSLRVVNE
jgi:Kelch motif